MMNNKNILLIIFILFSITTVSSLNLKDNIPYYIAVNDTFKVEVTNGFNGSENLFFITDSETNMTYDSINNNYYLYISSDSEENLSYEIIESSNDTIYHSGGSGISTGELKIDSQSGNANDYFLFSYEYNTSPTIGKHSALVCANLRKETPIDRNVIFTVGKWNGTSYNRFNSTPHLISNSDFQVHCEVIVTGTHEHEALENITSGFYCTDCTTSGIYLETDTNTSFLGRSAIYEDDTGTFTVQTDINYELFMLLESYVYLTQHINGIIHFRIPYYVEVQIYRSNETLIPTSNFEPYCSEFSQVYLKDYASVDIFDTEQQTSFMNSFFDFFDFFNLRNSFDSLSTYGDTVTDETLYFTNNYEMCSANITLYENGNYSAFVLSGRTDQNTDYTYVFTNPRDGTEKYVSQISGDDVLMFNDKSENYIVKIIASDWDISKTDVVINIVKWFFIVALPILFIFLIKSGVLGALAIRVINK